VDKLRVSVDATQVSDDCELSAAATLREMKQFCEDWGGGDGRMTEGLCLAIGLFSPVTKHPHRLLLMFSQPPVELMV